MSAATPPIGFSYTDTPFFGDPDMDLTNPDHQRIMIQCDRCFSLVMWEDAADHLAWHNAQTLISNFSLAQIPVLALGATRDISFTWDQRFDTTDYRLKFMTDGALVGRANLSLQSKTPTGCVIRVSAALSVSLGTLFVFAQGPALT